VIFRAVRSRWSHAALVCAKCEKKLGGGFGEKRKQSLAKLLKRALGKGRKADIGVTSVKCLGVCPKNAVTVIDTRHPESWLIVPAGTPAGEVVAALH
jgi:predicted metal-binding protein